MKCLIAKQNNYKANIIEEQTCNFYANTCNNIKIKFYSYHLFKFRIILKLKRFENC